MAGGGVDGHRVTKSEQYCSLCNIEQIYYGPSPRKAGAARAADARGGGRMVKRGQPKDSIMEGNGDTPYFRHALVNYMRHHGLEACDPCSLPAYVLTGLLREAEERRAHHYMSPPVPEPTIAVASLKVPARLRSRKM